MPLNIKDPQTQLLAKRLAELTGESLTQAIRQAVQERLARVERMRDTTSLADDLDRIALHCARLPVRDARDAEEIVGYDDRGLPS